MELFSQNFYQDGYSEQGLSEKSLQDSSIADSDNASSATFAMNEAEQSELLLSGLARARQRVDGHLRSILRAQEGENSLLPQELSQELAQKLPQVLLQGMHAGLLEGGKRVRPFLLFASAQLAKALAQKPPTLLPAGLPTPRPQQASQQAFERLGEGSRLADDAAAALELVHSYSLVHDDLPSMDGDLLRRGKPTLHVRFGEGQAILVGDGLLTLAFEVLATSAPSADSSEFSLRLSLIKRLAVAAGIGGMVGGQSMDLAYADKASANPSNKRADESLVRLIHARKTGALLRAACAMGAYCDGANESISESLCVALDLYGRAIGEAYQIVDDLCDFADAPSAPSATASLAPSDAPCYVRAVGKSKAEEKARVLCLEAEASIIQFGEAALPLVLFARFLPSRIPSLQSPSSLA